MEGLVTLVTLVTLDTLVTLGTLVTLIVFCFDCNLECNFERDLIVICLFRIAQCISVLLRLSYLLPAGLVSIFSAYLLIISLSSSALS